MAVRQNHGSREENTTYGMTGEEKSLRKWNRRKAQNGNKLIQIGTRQMKAEEIWTQARHIRRESNSTYQGSKWKKKRKLQDI